ncbi:hypothetical protein CCACVL1_08884 [Corchorus capsularis]|uniref:Uncharacterized protein n=1 Tax=Corchorus capsularis TaxID=210143 RepID=A0A1R3IYG6_COCAP|nr:hypothetical protein CCACVL1_08884 [Corchorus capsularis]
MNNSMKLADSRVPVLMNLISSSVVFGVRNSSFSAPPNLDEQRRDQACHDSSFRSVPNLPTPVPKHQLPKKDSVAAGQSNSEEAHPVPKVKKDVQSSAAPTAGQTQKPSFLSMPKQMLFYQKPHVSMQFGGHNPHSVSKCYCHFNSKANAHAIVYGRAPQVQQQVFVPGLQPQLHQILRLVSLCKVNPAFLQMHSASLRPVARRGCRRFKTEAVLSKFKRPEGLHIHMARRLGEDAEGSKTEAATSNVDRRVGK